MVSLLTQAATDHTFNEATLRQSLSVIANRSHATGEDVEHALEKGWKQGVAQAMTDGIITRDEEQRLRTFRDSPALENSTADLGSMAMLDRSGAAISVQDGDGHLRDLALSIRQADLNREEADRLLIQAWEAAV